MNEEIRELADVLDCALLGRLGDVNGAKDGFGVYYAKALYAAGYRRIKTKANAIEEKE